MKLSRVLSNENGVSRQCANRLIATGQVQVDGEVCSEASRDISRFQRITVNGRVIQAPAIARYLMLNKPAGILSATRDPVHRTVMDLMPLPLRNELHIAGRLDRASTGLMILTNDGNWSRRLTEPGVRVPKVYRVTTLRPVQEGAEKRFSEGIWFAHEGLTTSPAILERLGPTEARVTIFEGRYHQVKRMFHAIGNQVVELHRECIGDIEMPASLTPGCWQELTQAQIRSVPERATTR